MEMAEGNKEDVDPPSHSIVQEWQEVYSMGKDNNRWDQHGKGKCQFYNKRRKKATLKKDTHHLSLSPGLFQR